MIDPKVVCRNFQNSIHATNLKLSEDAEIAQPASQPASSQINRSSCLLLLLLCQLKEINLCFFLLEKNYRNLSN